MTISHRCLNQDFIKIFKIAKIKFYISYLRTMPADKRPLEIPFLKSCVIPLHNRLFCALFYHIRLLTYNLVNLINLNKIMVQITYNLNKIKVQTSMANGHFGFISFDISSPIKSSYLKRLPTTDYQLRNKKPTSLQSNTYELTKKALILSKKSVIFETSKNLEAVENNLTFIVKFVILKGYFKKIGV